ncbi:endonuclease/exonuclease/phosphatase family protein [Brumimicrobium aurantiacum]|uniref:Endonuclease/exonuclease/phosphatase family protein n=1 Tax=Brumimicrobium aurantiacum TaxID=1737063 RepID=A0A3E1EUZ5_9FLAO|nr:endonuclease/exonuclease/phosphatase family protein [Brumimicrobium aurantiacum]RFC53396.1 endonuclease/exonuclease/phosphatase family protein [Brumimicrobium aurantiacum]
MDLFFLILSIFLIVLGLLPFIQHQHWIFRVPEFLNLQLLVIQPISVIGLTIFVEKDTLFYAVLAFQLALIVFHIYIFTRYTKFYSKNTNEDKDIETIKVISTNIYQFNKQFERFKNFIKKENPDIFITIESNSDWEEAMRDLEIDFPNTHKVTLENTYGMHLYSKIPFENIKTHYFVADDVPSIEAHLKNTEGQEYLLYIAHPPPPSPTEESNSKERDGDLMCIAKRVKEIGKPTLVIGDFNTVAWSKISELFRKNSELIDGRHGRGILATFHAKYWFFRAPLDLVYHSKNVFVKDLKVLEHVGSDHFPICCEFGLDKSDQSQKVELEDLDKEEVKETEQYISEGKAEESEKR